MEKSQTKTNQHLCLFEIHISLFLIPEKGELHKYIFLDYINVPLVILNQCLLVNLV